MDQKKLIILIAVGLAAFTLTRKANATTLPATATTNKAMQPVNAGGIVNSLSGLASGIKSLFSTGINAAALGTGTSAAADGTAGEAAAAQYYLDNADSFAVNPPNLYQVDSGTTTGYLDGL